MGKSQPDFEMLRKDMVNTQLINKGINDQRVLDVMRTIPRHLFVAETSQSKSYEDKPLGIGHAQTISQPYMVALMTQLLEPSPNAIVLEVGTGSGYQTAILASLYKQVFSIERHAPLAQKAAQTVKSLGYSNISIQVGDGSIGNTEQAPFDAIIVTAGGPKIPEALKQQLNVGGRMVCPVGGREYQDLLVITRTNSGFTTRKHSQCRFVPLIGQEGWDK